jgi:integrase
MSASPPPLPYPDFPLRPHRNGQWYKSVWNRRTKKTEQFYFGSWADDPQGEGALHDPQTGWLARRDGIRAGIDNIRVTPAGGDLTLGELMSRFLTRKRSNAQSGELSKTTLGDYLREVSAFVSFMKPGTPAGGLRPEHFSAYMSKLTEKRGLGRHARKRVRAYITAFLHYGAGNGWFPMPNTGTDWTAPSTDPDAMRQARSRAGLPDYSDRILNGEEVDRLLSRASPAFKAMILVGVNCGRGPADLGRLRWNMLDLGTGQLVFPRPKTGAMRVGYLWRKTRRALERVRTLKHNQISLTQSGEQSLVFLTRKGLPFYREIEVNKTVAAGDQVSYCQMSWTKADLKRQLSIRL